jgi:hypothetical protein
MAEHRSGGADDCTGEEPGLQERATPPTGA